MGLSDCRHRGPRLITGGQHTGLEFVAMALTRRPLGVHRCPPQKLGGHHPSRTYRGFKMGWPAAYALLVAWSALLAASAVVGHVVGFRIWPATVAWIWIGLVLMLNGSIPTPIPAGTRVDVQGAFLMLSRAALGRSALLPSCMAMPRGHTCATGWSACSRIRVAASTNCCRFAGRRQPDRCSCDRQDEMAGRLPLAARPDRAALAKRGQLLA